VGPLFTLQIKHVDTLFYKLCSDIYNMFLVDYIVVNFDRHMKNFGVIRNVETLKWERVCPIFDTGECTEPCCNK